MDIKYKTFDILIDDNLKEWLKFYSNWPSFPQVYINQQFIGGTEIVLQLIESDDFLQLVPSECIKANALERIKIVMDKSVVVLYMKGSPTKP
jgi:glutaredoxin-related protein